MNDTALLNGTNLRMDRETWRRVDRLARHFRVKKSDLLRNAIYTALPGWEEKGITLVAPKSEQKQEAA